MRQLPSETRTIGDVEVTITKFDVTRAAPLAAKLGKIMAPALAELQIVGFALEGRTSVLDQLVGLAPMLHQVFESVALAGDFNALAGEILAGTSVVYDGKKYDLVKPGAVTLAFGDDLDAYTRTIAFALEFNFKGFMIAVFSRLVAAGKGNGGSEKAATSAVAS